MGNKTNALNIIQELREKGVDIWEDNGKIKYKASIGTMTSADMQNLKKYKENVIDILTEENKKIEVINNEEERYEPFGLTDVQQAYLMGRNNLFDYGDVACHIYLQLNYDKLDIEKVEKIWQYIIEKHEMLRAVVYEEGYQKILKEVPKFKVKDYGNRPADEIMKEIGHSKYIVGKWPFFSVGISEKDNTSIMHFSIEFLIADWTSIWIILSQFEGLYYGTLKELPDYTLSFRDYVIAEKFMRETKDYKKDKQYWLNRVDNLYEAPKLPINKITKEEKAEFERRFFQLPVDKWQKIKSNAKKNSITTTTLILMAYASVLERWSSNKEFSLNLTVLNRLPIHEEVNKIVGDFTSVNILEIDFNNNNSFVENARKTNSRLFEDLDHKLFSGVEVMREIGRRRSKEEAFMPYVFTSAIGLLSSIKQESLRGMTTGIGISQTPQVFIDCQVMDGAFGMQVDWDVRKGVFQEDMIKDMFNEFENLVKSFEDIETLENYKTLSMPDNERKVVEEVNNTYEELPKHLIHENILKQAEINPKKTAFISGNLKISYKEILNISYGIYNELIKNGCKPGDKVVIFMEKSVYQVAAAIAILCGKATYVPITINQGKNRTKKILNQTKSNIIITTSNNKEDYFENIKVINVDKIEAKEEKLPRDGDINSLAYIIFTSGSTGEPKGVSITHKAAVNTIEDINKKFNVTEKDAILGVSELNFDLSVYDIFGVLSVGGTLVYPEEDKKRDPVYLSKIINDNNITIWNSVPALLQMIMMYSDSDRTCKFPSVRLVLLSGDWIPLNLPDNFIKIAENAKIISLGGATEGAIWSIYHEYNGLKEGYNSIPYGKPLANQGFRILDSKLQDCPIGVTGELYIIGEGLAEGYYGDEERTKNQFFRNPDDNVMMYKTGDLGKYHKDGNIEFEGRSDNQIKFNGHRIELGEIEAVVSKHSKISNCSVIYNDAGKDKSLCCFYETNKADVNISKEKSKEIVEICEGLDTNAELIMKNETDNKLKEGIKARDRALVLSMAKAIKKCLDSNVVEFTKAEVINSEKISNKYRWLVSYWINRLCKEKYIIDLNNKLKFTKKILEGNSREVVANAWHEAKDKWIPEMGEEIFFNYLHDSCDKLNELLSEKEDPIKILYPDGKNDIVTSMYLNNPMSKYLNKCICDFALKLANENRTLRILEVGAGTCATSLQVVEALKDKEYCYHVTDIQKFFIPAAQKKFEGNNNIRFSVLNIDEDVIKQGFMTNSYDLIIAVGVLENTKDIRKSIEHVRELLVPGGYFAFTEPVFEEPWILASQGFLMTKPEDEIRLNRAFINKDKWIDLLKDVDGENEVVVIPRENDKLEQLGLDLFIKQFKVDKISVKENELKSFISESLPSYMIPNQYYELDNMPITSNGKINRKLLKEIIPSIHTNIHTNINTTDNMTTMQKEIAKIWCEVGIINLSLTDNFYSCGADSLIMAQVTGKLREGVGKEIEFDMLLRQILNYPTIEQVADFIEEQTNNTNTNITKKNAKKNVGIAKNYPAGDGPLRVVFHAALGTMNCFRFLIPHLVEQNRGNVMTIAIDDAERYYNMDPSIAVQELADEYVKLILETGATSVQLIGYCFGGWIALETANRLQEQNIKIENMVLVDCQTVPWIIEDDLLMEVLFIPNLFVEFSQIGLDDDKEIEEVFTRIIDKYRCIPANITTELNGDKVFNKFGDVFRKLGKKTIQERFQYYTELAYKNTGRKMEPDMALGMFRAFKETMHAVHGEMQPYVGDIRYLLANEFTGMFYDSKKNLKYWKDLCLGEFSIDEINGNHYTCIESEPNATVLADKIAEF